jgi:Cu2+-exporting ATPase
MAGVGKGAENGILVKDAESLELAKKVNAVVLDKTGTITEGKPRLTDIQWLNGDDRLLPILLAIEKESEHPLAEAVVNHFGSPETVQVHGFESKTGVGVTARVDDKTYYVGNMALLQANAISLVTELKDAATRWLSEAKTVIYFANTKEVVAVIAISDLVKPASKEAIRQIQDLGIAVYMLTGDNPSAAKAIADQVGITHFEAEVLPGDKAAFIKNLQQQGKTVAMVGDGINDSNALAQADVSIAMGKGSDIAMDVAKMTIISSDLSKIPKAIRLSKYTVTAIRQNLFWAFIYNLAGIPIAAGILYPINGFLLDPMIAGAAMALSSVSVVANSLRLKSKKL